MNNNKKQYSHLICILVLAAALLSGCLPERGDWSYPLTGGYVIDRANAHGIALTYSEDGEYPRTYVIENFFVTDFCSNQGFIGIKGFPTADIWATDEEMQSADRVYYLISVASGQVHGPYQDQESFDKECRALSSRELGIWKSTADITAQEGI